MNKLLSKVEYIIIAVLGLIFVVWTISKCSQPKVEEEIEYIDGINSFEFQCLATVKDEFMINMGGGCCIEQDLHTGDTVEWYMDYPDSTVTIYAVGDKETIFSFSQTIPTQEFFNNFENFQKIE